jgi:hypothetical protein
LPGVFDWMRPIVFPVAPEASRRSTPSMPKLMMDLPVAASIS